MVVSAPLSRCFSLLVSFHLSSAGFSFVSIHARHLPHWFLRSDSFVSLSWFPFISNDLSLSPFIFLICLAGVWCPECPAPSCCRACLWIFGFCLPLLSCPPSLSPLMSLNVFLHLSVSASASGLFGLVYCCCTVSQACLCVSAFILCFATIWDKQLFIS